MARYADRLLADGERPVLRTRQHWIAPLVEARTAWAILIASIVLIVLNTNLSPGTLRDLIGYFADVLLIVALAWIGLVLIGWYSEDYLVTNRRVLKVDGILRKRSADSSLEKINDAVLEQSVLGRMLGYGDLEILTAAEAPVDHYSYLNQAPNFKRTMLDEKHRLEQEVYDFPGPPLRASAPVAAQPLAPATAAAFAGGVGAGAGGTVSEAATSDDVEVGPSRGDAPTESVAAGADTSRSMMSSDEITRALGNLADLRDRGAITAEEFEAKKQDLLGRL
ncbi:MAG TPA: PH domain-containing protein [Candidatus Limnocylindrales bacterium]|nr:PH domain-containing protein [Candidatus Limnocylindrales bacterium]